MSFSTHLCTREEASRKPPKKSPGPEYMDAKSSFPRHKHADTICFHNTNSSNCGCECAGTRAACMRMNMFGMDVFAMARVRRACTWSLFSPCKLDENFAASTSYTNSALRLWSNRRYQCQDIRTCQPHNGPKKKTFPAAPEIGAVFWPPFLLPPKHFGPDFGATIGTQNGGHKTH